MSIDTCAAKMKFAVLSIFVFIVALGAGEDTYPLTWIEVDYKGVIDNDRLLNKYHECYNSESAVGCPPIVLEIKSE